MKVYIPVFFVILLCVAIEKSIEELLICGISLKGCTICVSASALAFMLMMH